MQHDTGTHLLFAVAASPDDDLPRLVYADWLDEQGRDDYRLWAAFIRTHTMICRGQLRANEYEENLYDVFRENVPNVLDAERFAGTGKPRHRFQFALDDYDRGFPAVASCTEQEWLDFGPNLVKVCPITRVDVTDRWPAMFTHHDGRPVSRGWHRQFDVAGPFTLKDPLYNRIAECGKGTARGDTIVYHGELEVWEQAADDLSAACLAYARSTRLPV